MLVCHTLLGPEETAEPVLYSGGDRLLSSSVPDRSAFVYRAFFNEEVVWCVQGWAVSRWVFEI
jgi:hypothetical protein